jgi:hypothetical protein
MCHGNGLVFPDFQHAVRISDLGFRPQGAIRTTVGPLDRDSHYCDEPGEILRRKEVSRCFMKGLDS